MAQRHEDHLILFRARAQDAPDKMNAACRAFEEKLLSMPLFSRQMTVMPPLYDLMADSPSFERLRTLSGRLVVLSWLPSRAAYWLLRGAGVSGSRVESPEDQSREARQIWCLDLHQYERPEDCVEAIRQILSESVDSEVVVTDEQAAVEKIDTAVSPRWYPIIDYDRCENCLECLNFCLFGVFGLDASEAVLVEQPDACRPGCPACARVCPSGAIMFPEHADPTISGRATGRSKCAQDNSMPSIPLLPMIDSLDLAQSEREASRTTKSTFPKSKPGQESDRDSAVEGGNRLDDLVDGLDAFDL